MSKLLAKRSLLLSAPLSALVAVLCGCGVFIFRDPIPQPPPNTLPGWTLVWSDEFSTRDGSSPDAKKWTYDLGGKGWGNPELEAYTNRPDNARIEKGNLVIPAQKETYTAADGITRGYTSARLKTQ